MNWVDLTAGGTSISSFFECLSLWHFLAIFFPVAKVCWNKRVSNGVWNQICISLTHNPILWWVLLQKVSNDFFGVEQWSIVPFLLWGKYKITFSRVHVHNCIVSIWMYFCKDPFLTEHLHPALLFAVKPGGAACQIWIPLDFRDS